MVRDTLAVVRSALKQGRALEQMKRDKSLAPWDSYGSGDRFIKTDAWIETTVNDLGGKGGYETAPARAEHAYRTGGKRR